MESRKSSVELAKEEIICPLCIDIFKAPRSLHCLHSYCEGCLIGLHKSTLFAGTITCPECRANTILPRDGIKGLKVNFKLMRFAEILSVEDKKELVRVASRRKLSPPPIVNTCSIHCNKTLEFYCEQCKELVCGQCVVEVHRLHRNVHNAQDVSHDCISSLERNATHMNTILSEANSVLKRLESQEVDFRDGAERDIAQAQTYFSELRKLLEERERNVCREIKTNAGQQKMQITSQKQIVCNSVDDLQRSRSAVNDLLKNRTDYVRILSGEQKIREKLEVNSGHLQIVLKDTREIDYPSYTTMFAPCPDFKEQCSTIGLKSDVFCQKPRNKTFGAPPTRARITALSKVGKRSQSSDEETMVTSPIRHFTCTGSRSVVSNMDSQSDFFLPKIPFPRSRTVTVPSSVTILLPCVVISSSHILGLAPKLTTAHPCGVCVGASNTLIVTDSQNHLFSILTPTGKCLEAVCSEGKGDGQFTEPTAVATDYDGNIYIVDKGSPSRIQKFSDCGKFISKFKVRGGLPYCTLLGDPLGVAIQDDGCVLVSDSEKSCIHLYDESGKYAGRFGDAQLHVRQPAGIATDSKGNVIIADRGNHCLYIFTSGGHFLSQIGKQGNCHGELLYPYGVTVGKMDNIFVSEGGNNRISEFTAGGKFLRCFGRMGSDPGMFVHPRHICIDSNYRLVVADEQNQRVQIFELVTDST